MSSATALSSTSRTENPLHHGNCVSQSFENRVGAVTCKLLSRITSRRHSDRASADCLTAANVRRRVADDNDTVTRDVLPEKLFRALLSEAGELGPQLVIRPKCIDLEAIDVDSRC